MNRFFLGIATLAALTLLIAGGARADGAATQALSPATSSAPSGAELAAQLQNIDDATLQRSAQTQADSLRQLPNELRAQGISVSSEQEDRLNQAADTLQAQASQPDFKEKVETALKSMGHSLKVLSLDAAKDTGKGIGYAGTATLAASFTPLTFTGDLVMGIAVGHGIFSKEPSPKSSASPAPGSAADSTAGSDDSDNDTAASHFEYEGAIVAGIGGFYLAYVGLDALGYTIAAPVIGSALGVVAANWLVCSRFDSFDAKGAAERPELQRFCSNNTRLAAAILRGSSRGGAIVGEKIHRGVLDTVHFLEKPFRHEKSPSAPSASVPASNPSSGSGS